VEGVAGKGEPNLLLGEGKGLKPSLRDIRKRGPLVMQTLYASVEGNDRAKKWK
jgi:hypothetical protein